MSDKRSRRWELAAAAADERGEVALGEAREVLMSAKVEAKRREFGSPPMDESKRDVGTRSWVLRMGLGKNNCPKGDRQE